MKLIDKSTLVAEIERMIEHNTEWKDACKTLAVLAANQAIEEDKKILSIIDTLEVKEVDLEKEIDFAMPSKYCWSGDGEAVYSKEQMRKFAKHFFELGMQASNKSQNVWHNADEKLPLGVIVVSNYGHLHIGWATDEGDGIEDEHGCLITKTYQNGRERRI